jgi:single-strand DNA-binding protein
VAISVNKVIIQGYVGQDPEKKGTGDGFVTMSVATSRSWRDKTSGEKVTKTEWHNVTIYNKVKAKFAYDYIKKGDLAYVEGRLESREYDDRDGIRRKVTDVVVAEYEGDVQSLSKDRGGSEDRSESRGDYGRSQSSGRQSRDFDDDIPF